LQMASDLGIITIAEGFETEKQVELLKLLKCDIIQSFYFYKPVPADDFPISYIEGNRD